MSQAAAKEKWMTRLREALRDGSLVKLTLGGSRGSDSDLRAVFIRPVELRDGPRLSFVYRHPTQDVTKNFPHDEAVGLIADLVGVQFRHAHLFTTQRSSELRFREGKAARLIEGRAVHATPAARSHDETKSRRIRADLPWLKALGIATAEGRIARGMEAKFRQINKFVEVLEHLLSGRDFDGPLSLVDMGCGKGYLTFAAHHWLGETGRLREVRGIEARRELAELCNRIAGENHLERLHFEAGTIADAKLAGADVVIALHACDTATDEAIAKGIAAQARLIVVSPCCHKELRPLLQAPPVLADALRHGILLERQAEFVTDALRTALLEWAGYDTKVFEFITTEHTAKNLMIAATRRRDVATRGTAARKVRELAAFYGVTRQRLAGSLGFDLSGVAS